MTHIIESGIELLLRQSQEAETARIQTQVIPEIDWWGKSIIEDEQTALATGQLLKVPSEGKYFKLVGMLVGEKEPRTVNPMAYALLLETEDRWQRMMRSRGENPSGIFLSVSSLYRSRKLQEELIKTSPLAARGLSAHEAGAVVDFDANGYYQGPYLDESLRRKPINRSLPEFNPQVTGILKEVLNSLFLDHAGHLIEELRFRAEGSGVISYTACYHFCVSPDYK